MKREAIGHSKMRRLCIYLDIPLWQAVGLLETLWLLTARETPTGAIGRLTNEDIAVGLDYRGNADAMVDALVRAKWLDESPEYRLVVHDWFDHSDDTTHAKLARARQFFADGRAPKFTKLTRSEREAADVWYAGNERILVPPSRIPEEPTGTPTAESGTLPCLALPEPSLALPSPTLPEPFARGRGPVAPMKPSPVTSPDWFEFRETAESAGIGGSSLDWDETWMLWRQLDPNQRQRATDGVRARAGGDDPALKSLPHNYIARRMWERPIRAPSGQSPGIQGGNDAVERAKAIARQRAERGGAINGRR
jgi:hypothetical protein